VTQAQDGEMAERILEKETFDIAIFDVMMRFRSGFDLLAWLRRRDAGSEMRVVLLTSQCLEENVVRAFSLGADDFIPKPFNPDVVKSRLKRLLKAR
jgi:DNA-binding response OmpR family regulator